MKTYFILLVTLLTTQMTFGQSGGLKGLIKTSDEKAASFVNVELKGTGKGTTTDNNGVYEIKNIAPGSYTLVTSFVGLKTKSITVEVNAGKTTSVPEIVLEENLEKLQEIVVQANREEDYLAQIPSQSLRFQGPLIEAPQNIQVITQKVINDQQSIDMLESVTRNVSGAQMIEHWGNFARINMRGFRVPAFRNGMNINATWGPLTEDMSFVERIEFVKGPAGFMLSSGEPGGLYNVVTKSPVRNQLNEVSMTMGSFNTLRATADFGGSLNEDGSLLYRLNIMGLTKGSHRDYEFNNRYSVAPSLKYQLTDQTSVTAKYIYQYSRMSVIGAAYVFSPNEFGDLPRDFTLAEPNIDPTNIHEHNIFIDLNHQINRNWSLTAKLGYLNYNQMGSSMWPDALDEEGNIERGLGIWDAVNDIKLGQIFVNGDVTTGSVKHKILAGVDLGHKDYYADWFQSGAIGRNIPFNIYAPTYGVPSDSLPVFDRSRSIRQRANGSYPAIIGQRYSSIYLQDQLAFFNNRARLTLAGRFTSHNMWSYGSSTDDEVFTPRVGLSVTIAPNTTVYGVFDESFLPETGVDADGNPLVPVEAQNIEGGIKRNWADGKWSSTLAVYQITKDNEPTAYPENPYVYYQLGQIQSKGVEFDVQGEIVEGLQIVLNYANTNVEVTEDLNEEIVGDRVAGHARHMTNGWLNYQFQNPTLNGLGVSLGYQYQIDRSSWNWGTDNEAQIPDYFRLDGALSWTSDDISIGLNINNILNEYLYSGSTYSLGGTTAYYWQTEPGTNFRLNVTYKF